jgi:ABC-2 type transport system permease protein
VAGEKEVAGEKKVEGDGPMSELRLVGYQALLEQRSFWRNPEYVVFTFALPPLLLIVVGSTKHWDLIAGTNVSQIALFVPSILAFGVAVAAFSNLATRIAILRSDGVLKRLRTTPLRPATYLVAQLVSTVVTMLMVALATMLLGVALYGVTPRSGQVPLLVLGLLVGVTCFAALGLALSTVIRNADAASPIVNVAYLPVAIVSGVFDPSMTVPGWLSRVVSFLPIKPLAVILEDTYNPAAHAFPASAVIVLVVWAVAGILIAIRWFRWQPVVS